MGFNSDINILGGLPDWNLVRLLLEDELRMQSVLAGHQAYTSIKTTRAVKRFEKAIKGTLLHFANKNTEGLVSSVLRAEGITADSKLLLFWNASYNNSLLQTLNHKAYFPALFSGRVSLRMREVYNCLKELQDTGSELKNWGNYTVEKTASKYLTLLKKFGLLEGSATKTIKHPFISDKMLVTFAYWIVAAEQKSNILQSDWLAWPSAERLHRTSFFPQPQRSPEPVHVLAQNTFYLAPEQRRTPGIRGIYHHLQVEPRQPIQDQVAIPCQTCRKPALPATATERQRYCTGPVRERADTSSTAGDRSICCQN